MTSAIIAVLVPTIALLLVIVPALARLLHRVPVEDITPEWMAQFSVSNYLPMEHLLNAEDFDFLSRQPGFDLSLYRKLRRERLQIFRMYLIRMVSDFNRLHTAAKIVLSQSEQDQSKLLNRLIWVRVRFSFAVLRAELSYYLCQLGLQTLPVRSLINELETLSVHLAVASAA